MPSHIMIVQQKNVKLQWNTYSNGGIIILLLINYQRLKAIN